MNQRDHMDIDALRDEANDIVREGWSHVHKPWENAVPIVTAGVTSIYGIRFDEDGTALFTDVVADESMQTYGVTVEADQDDMERGRYRRLLYRAGCVSASKANELISEHEKRVRRLPIVEAVQAIASYSRPLVPQVRRVSNYRGGVRFIVSLHFGLAVLCRGELEAVGCS